jgi:hypothetical protein
MFENKALRKLSKPERDIVIGDQERLHNEELHKFHSSPSIFIMLKSRRMSV